MTLLAPVLKEFPVLATLSEGEVSVCIVSEPSGSGGEPLPRRLEIYDLNRLAVARERLLERLHRLLACGGTHLLTPIAAELDESAGLLRVLYPAHGDSLAAVPADALDPACLPSLMQQLVAALEELKAAGMAHGNIQPTEILVVASDNGRNVSVKLAGALAGPLAHWTSGDVLLGDTASYWPPEWKGIAGEPGQGNDLYAAAIAVAEAPLGDSVEQPFHRSKKDHAALNQLLDQLGQRGVARRFRTTLRRLLEPGYAARIGFLCDARELLHSRPASWAPTIAAAVLTCGLLVALVWGWIQGRRMAELQQDLVGSKASQQQLTTELSNLHASRRDHQDRIVTLSGRIAQLEAAGTQPGSRPDLDARIAELERDKAALQAANASLRATLGQNAPPRSLDAEKREWASKLVYLPTAGEGNWGEALFSYLQSVPVDGAPEFAVWKAAALRLLQERKCKEWCGYVSSDAEVQLVWKSVREAILQPWDQEKMTLASVQIEALDLAAREWALLAQQSNLTWEVFKTRLNQRLGKPDEVTKYAFGIVNQWFEAFDSKMNWKIELFGAFDLDAKDLNKDVIVTGSTVARYSHSWTDKAQHSYVGDPNAIMEFTWKPNTEICVQLTRTDGIDVDQIDHWYTGPVAVWLMYRSGFANTDRGKQSSASLTFYIHDCPGPPRDFGMDVGAEGIEFLTP